MSGSFDPESVDLAQLADHLRRVCGERVGGDVVGRTILRDEVVRRLGCSQLDGENLVDTMVGRGFARLHEDPAGGPFWVLSAP